MESLKQIQVLISLSEKEARWLRGVMQHPNFCKRCYAELGLTQSADEDQMRDDLFKILRKAVD